MPFWNILPSLLMGVARGAPLAGLSQSPFQQMGAGGALLSDEDMKKMEEEQSQSIAKFLDTLQSYQFEYKNPKHGKGKKYGVMTQDLEKSKVGKAMVKDTDQGKMIDIGQGVGITLAALSFIHDRLKKLEGNNAK